MNKVLGFVSFAIASVVFSGCASHGSAALTPAAYAPLQSTAASAPFAATCPTARTNDARFDVVLPLRNEKDLDALIAAQSDPSSPQFRHFISREEFVRRFAPAERDRDAVAQSLRSAGLEAGVTDQAVLAAGAPALVARYFHTRLSPTADGRFAANGPLAAPLLDSLHAVVIGLDGAVPAETLGYEEPAPANVSPRSVLGPYGPYFPNDLKQAYQYPAYTEASGSGETIAIVINSAVRMDDVAKMFSFQGLAPPNLTMIPVCQKSPAIRKKGQGEATLDVDQSASMAPSAHVELFVPPTLSNEYAYAAYAAIVAEGDVTVVNSSWGGCEDVKQAKTYQKFESLFKQGLSAGTTFVASSGDTGARLKSCAGFPKPGVLWPAASPSVVAVGGTNLQTAWNKSGSDPFDSSYVLELSCAHVNPAAPHYWGSGGGYSKIWQRPDYQSGFVSAASRGVPDMAGHMGGVGGIDGKCPRKARKGIDGDSDFSVLNGELTYEFGTSASSPDTAGLIALWAEVAGSKLGDVHPVLYADAKSGGFFHTNIVGFNGYYYSPGSNTLWNPVVGLGTPIGYKIAGATTPAGSPFSATNP